MAHQTVSQMASLLTTSLHFHLGALGEVLHCYIFSNSIDVFKNSYQASLSTNLMELLTEEARQDRPFLAARGDFFFTGDEDAPIDLTAHELSQFELRNDITAFRSEIEKATGRERTLLRDRYRIRIRALSALQLEFKRAQFFDQIDEHRARGLPTDDIRSKALKERTILDLAPRGAAISQFLLKPSSGKNYRTQTDDMPVHRAGNIRWMELLLENLRGAGPGAAARAAEFQCLLCEAPFSALASLTRHVGAKHKDVFLRPHKCPRCAGEVTAGSEAWSIHCATTHGPNFTPKPAAKSIPCFCGSSISLNMFISHINKHAKPGKLISCKECEDLPSMGLDEWLEHLQDHKPVSCSPFQRCRLCDKVFQDVHLHHLRTHKNQEKPFRCLDCGREADGLDAHEAHVLESHTMRGGSPLTPSYPSAASTGEHHEHDERELNARHSTESNNDTLIDTANDIGLDNIETLELMGKLLNRIDSVGWSDGESLKWMRELRTRIMQSGSSTGPVTKNENKRSTEGTLDLEKVKRPKLLHEVDDTDVDTTVSEDGGMAASEMDYDDDGSEWDMDDNINCSLDACDDDEDQETLAAMF